jgi:NLI interacting factor-like phosphatase
VQVHAELSAGVHGPLRVVPRPGLSEFLARASRMAELVVFTAAAPGESPWHFRIAVAQGRWCDLHHICSMRCATSVNHVIM